MTIRVSALGRALAFLNTRIGQRFLAMFLAISLLPLAIVGWFAIRSSESKVREQTLALLRVASDGAEAEIREYLEQLKQAMLELARDETVIETLESSAPKAATSAPAHAAAAISRVLTAPQQRIPEVQEVMILDRSGRVLASTAAEQVGKDLSQADCFLHGRQSFYGGDVFEDPAVGRLTWIMAAPVYAKPDHRFLGVAEFRINPKSLSALTTGERVLQHGADTQSFRIGDKGETYIVNRDRLMITESRFISNAVLRVKVDTLPVRVANDQRQEITANYKDYRGIDVSGASIILRDMGWVVLTEIDFSESFAPVQRLGQGLLAVTVGLGLVVVLLAWSSTRRIIRPIQMLYESDRALAVGDRKAAVVPEQGLPNDELGELVRRRNVRVKAVFAYQQQLEEQAARLKEALSELEHMSYSIMHDMRAPLRAIIGFGDMIAEKEGKFLSAESRGYLERMKAASVRMDYLIRDVLNYSVIARAELPLHPVNVSELVRSIVETYPALQQPQAEISVATDMPAVQGNEAALTQCFSNLLENAVKFAQPGRTAHVQVHGEAVDGWVRISVEDDGVGIPAGMQDRIFRLFQRGSNAGDSTGIGLAIVRKAAERMGGRVGVISELGHGSRFWVELHMAN